MNISSHKEAILALFVTSLLMRVLPVFIRPRLTASGKNFVERVLPLAAFINFTVYILWTEINISVLPAIAGIVTIALASFFTRVGLFLITFAATLVYALIVVTWPA